jgi:Protein of unknown function (DUF3134)
MNNPSLKSEPRTQSSLALKTNHDVSLLGWLEESGRFMERDIVIDPKLLEEDDELSAALIGTDDYGDDDDDFSDDED